MSSTEWKFDKFAKIEHGPRDKELIEEILKMARGEVKEEPRPKADHQMEREGWTHIGVSLFVKFEIHEATGERVLSITNRTDGPRYSMDNDTIEELLKFLESEL